MIEYSDEDLLMLSGIQHLTFCERQWALIHIEQQWSENRLTIEGNYLHKKVDDPQQISQVKGVVTFRSVSLISRRLGLYGLSDVVELHQTDSADNAILSPKHKGFWKPYPVEYKHGKPKKNAIDEVQLCAQAICLEELYHIQIEKGSLYYAETKHRTEICFTPKLRKLVETYAERMHKLFKEELTPLANYKAHCKSCSLYDICLPKQFSTKRNVKLYLKTIFD